MVKTSILLVLLVSSSAFAQVVEAQVDVSMPTIHFDVAPPLVVARPGVMVVQDRDEEIFFTGSWYWYRRGPVWYRTRSYRGGWVIAPRHAVPANLMRMPRGRYCHFHPGPGHPLYRPMHGGGPRRGSRMFAGGPVQRREGRGPSHGRGGHFVRGHDRGRR